MSGEILSTSTSTDQEKFIALDLIRRSYLKLVFGALCDKVTMRKGAGLTANFIRYKRMSVPLAPITEGNDPANNSFTIDTVTVTLDQWGDIITVTDVAQLTTLHPIVQQCVELLADNAARVMDREITLVLLAGTNIIYGDGSVVSRSTITTAMKMNDVLLGKIRVAMVNNGAPPRGGPVGDAKQVSAQGSFLNGNAYVIVCGPEISQDVMQTSTSLGSWASTAMYANQKALYNTEIGTWLSFRFVETNFIPRFTLIGTNTTAVVSGSAFGTDTPTVTAGVGGTLGAGTWSYKVTRKDVLRGFEEDISIEHTTATAGSGSLAFNFTGVTTGYVYNIYLATGFGVTGDAAMRLVASNVAVGATATITAAGVSSVSAPANILATAGPAKVHPVFVLSQNCLNWVGFYDIQMRITGDAPIIGNVLGLKKAIGYKFFGKSMIRDQTRVMRVELASNF